MYLRKNPLIVNIIMILKTNILSFYKKITWTIAIGDKCPICFNNASDSCVKCNSGITDGINLIKCQHYSVPEGKKIVYFCDDDNCSLKAYRNVIIEKLTEFDNQADRIMIERRTF